MWVSSHCVEVQEYITFPDMVGSMFLEFRKRMDVQLEGGGMVYRRLMVFTIAVLMLAFTGIVYADFTMGKTLVINADDNTKSFVSVCRDPNCIKVQVRSGVCAKMWIILLRGSKKFLPVKLPFPGRFIFPS